MYKFREYTERISKMRERVRDRVIRYDSDRALILTETSKKYEHVIPVIKRPLMLLELCKKISICIDDNDLIVASRGPYYFSGPMYPDWGQTDWIYTPLSKGEWTIGEDGLYHNPDTEELRQCISPEDCEKIFEIKDYWLGRKMGTMADAWQPEGFDELSRLNVSSYVAGGMSIIGLPAGHLVAGYDKIIKTGYAAIRKQAQDWLDEHRGNTMGEDMNKYMFYTSAAIVCDAAIIYTRRHAEKVREMEEKCADEKRRAELNMMAEGLEWISENPARSFWEALQGVMMYQMVVNLESKLPSPALGRLDQYTWPYLKKDLEAGRVTMDQAQEMLDAFFLRANCLYTAGPMKLVDTTGIGNTYQHTTIGGCDPDTGEDATNPVTYMVLETIGRLKLHDPTISLRISRNTPHMLWDCALQTSRLVGGLPLFQNEEVIIPMMMEKVGFSLRDARNFGVIGCQEIVGCGTDYPAPNGLHPPHASVWWGNILDMALNNGINPLNGEQASLKTGYLYEMNSIEEVREAVKRMSTYIIKLFISTNNYAEYISQYYAPHAILSISIEGCMENGRDCTAGGAKYNSYGGTATGLATLADSLSTIKYMCFDKKLCTARELYDAFMANWKGYDMLRETIANQVPHFGNADPYADQEMEWLTSLYCDICSQCHSVRSKIYKPGLYGASDHVAQGRITWATPDGRRFGEPIADAASPAQGRDKNGPISVFNSSCCYNNGQFPGGIALNLRIHPSVFAREDGIDKVKLATQTYFANGGLEVQYNVVDSDTLRAAQKEPEKYRDLVVRIAGYSAYFVELGKALQNDIISRNENTI